MQNRNRPLIFSSCLLIFAVLSTSLALNWSMRRSLLDQTRESGLQLASQLSRTLEFADEIPRDVETILGQQMVVQASLAAHLVAIAESKGLNPQEINRHLQEITGATTLDEFWITDEKGHAYLRNKVAIDFSFDPDPKKQPQAHIFYPLLLGKTNVVIQQAMRREVDDQTFKYAAVAGIDKPRIVQVGYNARILRQINQQLGLPKIVSALVKTPNVLRIQVVDRDLKTLAFQDRNVAAQPETLTSQTSELLQKVQKSWRPEIQIFDQQMKVIAPIGGAKREFSEIALIHLDTSSWNEQLQKNHLIAVIVGASIVVLGLILALFFGRNERPQSPPPPGISPNTAQPFKESA
jgi:hypothetical protein